MSGSIPTLSPTYCGGAADQAQLTATPPCLEFAAGVDNYWITEAPGKRAMIRYALKCEHGHEFESWFASAAAFETLAVHGHVGCPDCGSVQVEKALMAPRLRPAGKDEAVAGAGQPAQPPVAADRVAMLKRLRAEIEANSEYVGMSFATEARRIHDGDAPERSIYGEARPEEARKLIEEGIPVAPLPFIPGRQRN